VNVNDKGEEINSGDLEITETDLVLKQGGSLVVWPLRLVSILELNISNIPYRSLRRYGFDKELFSFECGRRCNTGPGIYAFRCREAEVLFNHLQEAINKCTSYPMTSYLAYTGLDTAAANPSPVTTELPGFQPLSCSVVGASPSPVTACEQDLRRDSYPLPSPTTHPIHNYVNSPIYNGSNNYPDGNHGSPSSSRPVTSCSLPTTSGVTDINTNYAKLDDLMKVAHYVNVTTPMTRSDMTQERDDDSHQSHNNMSYSENHFSKIQPTLAPSPRHDSRFQFQFPPISSSPSSSAITTPNMTLPFKARDGSPVLPTSPSETDPVNYIMLELGNNASHHSSGHFVTTCPATPVSKTPKGGETVWPSPGEVPGTPTSVGSVGGGSSTGPKLSYAMIDFDKTEALTSAANKRKGHSCTAEVTS